MEKANYVLKAKEGVTVPKNESLILGKIKISVWIITSIIIIVSIISHDNMFSKISWLGIILLVILAVRVSFIGGYKRIPAPFEIQFYDDHMVIYRDKRYRSRNVIMKEYNKYFYKDIKICEYRMVTKQIRIKGIAEVTNYQYKKDGNLPDKPYFHKTCENLCYFYTTESPEINFISEIENHSPIKVKIVDGC